MMLPGPWAEWGASPVKRLSIVLPYYKNPKMLAYQYDVWRDYAQKDCLEFVVVDDGSPENHAIDVPRPDGLPPLSIYRVTKDIPWNQHGARNLGALVAKGPWLLMTDIDHVMMPDAIDRLIGMKAKRDRVYTFHRLDAPHMTPAVRPDGRVKPHVNSFLLTREAYWDVGGYDEDFCGVYGTDGQFRGRMYSRYKQHHLEDLCLVRFGRDVVADADTTTLERGSVESIKKANEERRLWKVAQGRENVVLTLNFPWERVL